MAKNEASVIKDNHDAILNSSPDPSTAKRRGKENQLSNSRVTTIALRRRTTHLSVMKDLRIHFSKSGVMASIDISDALRSVT